MLKIFKMAGIIVVAVLLALGVGGGLFLYLSPQFGGSHSKQDLKRYQASGNFKDGKFFNQIPTSMDMELDKMLSTMVEYLKGDPSRKPAFDLPVEKVDSLNLAETIAKPKLVWFGHSAVLLQLGGKNILIDPMLSEVPAPHPSLGNKRYSKELPIEIEKLPAIDVILISHDHYDHLDYESVQQLKDKTKKFYVPLGVGAHLRSWGVAEDAILEMNWWEQTAHEDIQLIFTPSRHFSGRGLTDRNTTLWGSWVIQANGQNIYFSGDGGYGPHFKEIGEKYGPFDFAMVECGQYHENWSQIHMMPEESVQAALDIQARSMMPVHWGAFTLSLHSWTDPVERATQKAKEVAMPIVVPKIGELVDLPSAHVNHAAWWKNLPSEVAVKQ